MDWTEGVRVAGVLIGLPTLIGIAVTLARLSWKIGQWQATTEERSIAAAKDREEIKRQVGRINGNVSEAHSRIDRHLEAHR